MRVDRGSASVSDSEVTRPDATQLENPVEHLESDGEEPPAGAARLEAQVHADRATLTTNAGARLRAVVATVGRTSLVERFGALGILLLAIGVFSILLPDTFPTLVDAKAILVSQAVLG